MAAGGALAAAPGTNVLVNGGFETPAVVRASTFDTKSAGAATLAPWVIGGNSINHIKGYWQPAEGLQSLDLNGNGPGSVAQVVPTEPGRSYLLRFKYARNPDRILGAPKMTVRWGPSASGTFTLKEQFTFTGSSSKTNMNWRIVERTVKATGASMYLQFKSDDIFISPFGVALDDVSVTLLPDLATPALLRVVATGGTNAALIGRVDGSPNLPILLQAYTAAKCTDGMLDLGGTAVGTPVAVTTDGEGYFGNLATSPVAVSGVPPGNFVAVKVTSPVTTAMSSCIASSADNDFWPKALDLGGVTTAKDYIDAPGKARWYKFAARPGQRIQINLSGLPADYDLAVFKDIGAAFLSQLAPANTAELTRLSAEYAPSVFSPSVFSPSVFSPSVFSPDAYAPSVFSPSVFSPSVFSPSVFSPSVFSPSVFSPSVFSPSVFSPSVFSPSVFSPSVFSPSVFSPSVFSSTEIAQAFSSAQTRSIIGVSATPGTVDEAVVVNTWNNAGDFYIRVAGRGTAQSTASQFTVTLAKTASSCDAVTNTALTARTAAPGAGIKTVILTDSTRTPLSAAVAGGGTLADKLEALRIRPDVAGVVVDVAAGVAAKKAQADANPACPFAKNLLAEEIKGIVDSYRANNPNLKYVVIVGGDSAIPFFRYPDQSLLGQESGYVPPVDSNSASEASLRRDFVLGQDAYGAGTQVSLRTSNFPVPGLAVGRLVESPSEIAGLIDAYIETGGVVVPSSSLVTGYDFLADAAKAVQTELQMGTGVPSDTLIAPNNLSPEDPLSWKASDLGAKLLGTRHDIMFLAGHFSANSALAADFKTSLLTTDLAASSVNLTNSIVFSAGCHSGYNIVDTDAIPGVTQTLDWTQAFAQKKATLIAGTGYQYGDTDFIEYSERLYRNFARQLLPGTGPVPIGEALVKAKLEYLAATPDIRGIHEKALLEATLFGLPMLGVNMPNNRGGSSGIGGAVTPQPVASGPAATLGLKTRDLSVGNTGVATNTVSLTNVQGGANVLATWLSGPDGVVSNPAEPALPLAAINVTPTDGSVVLRGVGFRGGTYTDSTIVPLTGAPTTELRGVHVPFVSPVFFPMRTWTVNYFGALSGGGGTSLLVTPAQHRAFDIEAGTSTLRRYGNLDLRLYYSGNLGAVALSDAPTVVGVDAQPDNGGIAFAAQVVGDPKAAIHQVWVTHTDGLGVWQSLDLDQCVRAGAGAPLPTACAVEDSRVWMGRLPTAPASLRYVVQAASGTGLVTLDDNRGLYYAITGAPPSDSAVALVTAPASATFGDSLAVTAALTSGGQPVAGKSVRVAIGGAARAGTTGADGRVNVNVPVAIVPGSYPITASFAGDETLAASSTTGPALTISQAPSTLAPSTSVPPAPPPPIGATLTATIGGKTQALLQETVVFSVSGAGGSKTLVAITDYLGRASLPPTGLPPGTYAVSASFAGNATYLGRTASLPDLNIAPQTIDFGPAGGGGGLPASITVPGTATFTVTTNAGQPVTVGLEPTPSPPGPYCTLSSTQSAGVTTYTLTAVAPGTCTLVASAGGTPTFASVTVTQPVIIKGDQAINFGVLADKTYGDAPFTVVATGGASGNLVTFASQTASVCAVSGDVVTILAAGTCTIAADQAGATNYNAAPQVTRSFTVNKSAQTITFGALGAKTFGNAPFAVSATASSGLTVTFGSGGSCSVSGTTVTIIGAGSCTITASQAGDGNYLPATSVPQTFAIGQAAQTITFGALTPKTYGDAPFAVSATASSGLSVSFAASGSCTVAGSTVTLTGAGSCTITASQGGGGNYLAAPQVVQSISIGQASQTITFAGPGDRPFTTVPIPLTATSTSGLTVAFAATGNCTVSGSTLTLTAAGSCTITASQPGDTNFAAATPVARTIAIAASDLANVWTVLTAKMTKPRLYHTATRFESGPLAGQVLIVGGLDRADRAQGSSELYNPVTRTFVAAGNLPSRASGHTATLLLNGKVVVFGGGNSSVQAFDPATKTWSSAGSLSSNRSWHTATLLLDGRVLVIGGADNSGNTLASTIVYNPTTGTYANGPTLDTPREHHTATALPNGKVLVVGGRRKSGSSYVTHATFQICDATSCTASTGGIAARHSHAATGLGLDGSKILVAGGANGSTDLATAEVYNTATGTWSTTGVGNLSLARRDLTLSELPNGRALAAGGSKNGYAEDESDVYGPPIGSMSKMKVKRAGHTATPLEDAAGNITGILVTGGANDDADADDALDSAEIYGTP